MVKVKSLLLINPSRNITYACVRLKIFVISKKIEFMEKFYSSKTLLKMVGRGMHPLHGRETSSVINSDDVTHIVVLASCRKKLLH